MLLCRIGWRVRVGPEQENGSFLVTIPLHVALGKGTNDGHETWEVIKVPGAGCYVIRARKRTDEAIAKGGVRKVVAMPRLVYISETFIDKERI